MLNDPLGASIRKETHSKPSSETLINTQNGLSKAQEFQNKLDQEAKEMLIRPGQEQKPTQEQKPPQEQKLSEQKTKQSQAAQDFYSPPQTSDQKTIITPLNHPQHHPQTITYTQAFTQIFDAPRKLLFKSTPNTQPSMGSQNDQDFQCDKLVLDIKLYEFDHIEPGEVLRAKINVTLVVQQNSTCPGILYISNYKFVFINQNTNMIQERKDTFSVPLAFITKVDRVVDKKQPDLSFVEILSKDGRSFKFKFLKEQSDESQQTWNLIYKSAFIDAKDKLFAFSHFKMNRDLELRRKGWEIYKVEEEFKRQKLTISSSSKGDNQEKQLFKYVENTNGSLCLSYPEKLVVPFGADNDQIIKTAKFRTKERLPILVYAQVLNEKKTVQMWRSSQCKQETGISGNRSQDDESYLELIAQQSINPSDQENKENILKIFDARPYVNALGQQVAGKGFESTTNYKKCTIEFLEIHNIHKVRDSYRKLQSLCQKFKFINNISETNLTLSMINSSEWYDHILVIIAGAVKIAEAFSRTKKNVLVHCSDGWDRTSQLLSLVQLMIDPYYRTLEGFMVLIQKDWVISGHQFCTRSGTGNKHHGDEQRAPIFIQFLDCVYQLLNYFPISFEFNHRILAELAIHYQSALFGTFICDSYQEISRFGLCTNTISVWSHLLDHSERYTNSYYKQQSSKLDNNTFIPKYFNAINLKFWKEHFSYHIIGSSDIYGIYPELSFIDENQMEMHREVYNLNQKLRQSQVDQENLIKAQYLRIQGLTKLVESEPNLATQLEQLQQNPEG